MITYHHIGGRNGTYPLPLRQGKLLQDFHLVLYDADADCFQQMEKAEKGPWGRVSIYPYCIGKKSGKGSFNINFHATTSSLYEFNNEFDDYTFMPNPAYGEYRLGDACQFVKSVEVDLFSLEDALKQANSRAIDFLSLDVQGAEYDVLDGAKDFLRDHCLGIQLEVEFLPIYKGQKTFSQINELMDEIGFELVELNRFGRLSPMILPMGFRSREQLIYAEAVYLKKKELAVRTKDINALYKLALFCLIYQKTGLCIKILQSLSALDNLESIQNDDHHYVKCLKRVWQLFSKERECCLPTIAEIFSHETLQAFYRGEQVNDRQQIDQRLAEKYSPLLTKVKEKQSEVVSEFERLLYDYELDALAESVKKNRIEELNCFMNLIQPLVETEKIV